MALFKNLNLTVDVSQDVPLFIKSDPCKIRIILSNLIDNSIKYTQTGFVKILVFMKNDKDLILSKNYKDGEIFYEREIEFTVIDSGIGITSEEQI